MDTRRPTRAGWGHVKGTSFEEPLSRAFARLASQLDGPVTLAPDSAEMKLRLNSLEEVERWILSFGKNIEVLAPGELRKRVAEVGRKMAPRHG